MGLLSCWFPSCSFVYKVDARFFDFLKNKSFGSLYHQKSGRMCFKSCQHYNLHSSQAVTQLGQGGGVDTRTLSSRCTNVACLSIDHSTLYLDSPCSGRENQAKALHRTLKVLLKPQMDTVRWIGEAKRKTHHSLPDRSFLGWNQLACGLPRCHSKCPYLHMPVAELNDEASCLRL